ncbi:MAG: restriction endonuclease [Chloroflexi bacterium]|nr:MAG: restriction endonuclease [Chloroflexota bacterium]
MALTQAQKRLIAQARLPSAGMLGIGLDDSTSIYLVATIVRDLDLYKQFPELPSDFPGFFDERDPRNLKFSGIDFQVLIERLLTIEPDADTYFVCLATLQKARLKYARILEYQPLPTMDQVGPRALLQYGQMRAESLAGFLLWRKWLFDIDNRAGQKTGYLFEPIVASAIGGVSFSAGKSPIRRRTDLSKGRQVDCIREQYAYEIKLRVTIAASGQGRWYEELEFPLDCRTSGFIPVLIVFDPTPNAKLTELIAAFESARGETYVGEAAWEHLEKAAGRAMSIFIEKYVKAPLSHTLEFQADQLPDIGFRMTEDSFVVTVGEETTVYARTKKEEM